MLSIIIPVLNEYKNLESRIPYLQNCLYNKEYEIIVVDSHQSTDKVEQLCQQSNIKYIISDRTSRSIQLNLGAQHSKGNILFFLHADVVPPEDFHDQILSTMDSGFMLGLFCYKFSSSNTLLKFNESCTKRSGVFIGGGDQGHFMTKKFYCQMNGYNEDMVIMEDFEFWRRVKKSKIQYRIVDSPAVVSSRKYKNNSWFRVNIVNGFVLFLFYCKMPSERIKQIYNRYLKPS